MAIGDGSFKFGFSRLGMGLDEAREAEAQFKADKAYADDYRRRERMGRRAYKEAARSGNKIAAYNLMGQMQKEGFNTGGIRQSGQIQGMLSERLDRKEQNLTRGGSLGQPNTPGLDSNPQQPAGEPSAFDVARGAASPLGGPTLTGTAGALSAFDEARMSPTASTSGPLVSRIMSNPAMSQPSQQLESSRETSLISSATAGMSPEGRSRLMEMAGKMGLSGQASADWMSQMREKGEQRSRNAQLSAQINNVPTPTLANFIESDMAKTKLRELQESQGKMSDSTRALIRKNKSESGLEWLLTQY